MANVKDTITRKDFGFWYPMITAFIGAAISWGAITTRVDYIEAKVDKQGQTFETSSDKVDSTLLDIQVRLAEIQTRQVEIQRSIDDIHKKVGVSY